MLAPVSISNQLTDALTIAAPTDHDLTAFNKKELALIGISLNNPYFTESRLTTILTGFSQHFKQVCVVLADSIAIHNFKAMGYADSKAQSKVKKYANQMANRLDRAMKQVGQENISIVRWSEIEACSSYQDGLNQVDQLYKNNPAFSAEIHTTTRRVMTKHISDPSQELATIQEAKWYLLKELALAYCVSDFFGSGLVTCYHKDFPVYRKVLHGDYTEIPVTNHGFLSYEVLA